MSGSGKRRSGSKGVSVAAVRKQSAAVNLSALQLQDDQVTGCVHTASHVVLYRLEDKSWQAVGINGPFFVVERRGRPRYKMFILNRKSIDNMEEAVDGHVESVEMSGSFLMYKTKASRAAMGVWFHEEKDVAPAYQVLRDIVDGRTPPKKGKARRASINNSNNNNSSNNNTPRKKSKNKNKYKSKSGKNNDSGGDGESTDVASTAALLKDLGLSGAKNAGSSTQPSSRSGTNTPNKSGNRLTLAQLEAQMREQQGTPHSKRNGGDDGKSAPGDAPSSASTKKKKQKKKQSDNNQTKKQPMSREELHAHLMHVLNTEQMMDQIYARYLSGKKLWGVPSIN